MSNNNSCLNQARLGVILRKTLVGAGDPLHSIAADFTVLCVALGEGGEFVADPSVSVSRRISFSVPSCRLGRTLRRPFAVREAAGVDGLFDLIALKSNVAPGELLE